jgi:hypothetical protein
LASKPADWFDEGNLPILAQYCDLVAEQADLVLRRNELYATKPRHEVPEAAGAAVVHGSVGWLVMGRRVS